MATLIRPVYCLARSLHPKAMESKLKHLIFDLDGTLIDSAPSILAGFAGALKIHGLTPRVALSDKLIGPPLKETLRIVSGVDDPEQLQALADSFKAYYDDQGYQQSGVYPGIAKMLETLQGRGLTLHIATNKRLNPTLKILSHFGWAPWFTHVYALDVQNPPFAHKTAMVAGLLAQQGIAPESAIYIGDKAEDGEAAKANDLPFIAVHWGYGGFTGHEPGWHHARSAEEICLLAAST